MTAASMAPTSGWKITGQVQTKALPPGAPNYIDGVQVSFVTGHQVTGSVFVPLAQYTTANVTAAVNERAAQLDAISTLSVDPA